jgi:hypothetical protein
LAGADREMLKGYETHPAPLIGSSFSAIWTIAARKVN